MTWWSVLKCCKAIGRGSASPADDLLEYGDGTLQIVPRLTDDHQVIQELRFVARDEYIAWV